jgi:zinc protease
MRLRIALPALVLVLLASGAAFAQEAVAPAGESRPWRHAGTDLVADARIQWRKLDGGLRLAWADNREPKERVYLRLHVDVGSLAEEDGERGLAHFLEHMAFNGLRDFPAGTLIEWFQERGMSFGADTNAHTGFSETVYKLDLPHHDAEAIREGLRVLRNFADGMLLAEEEVQAEKGVIDGEERERESPGMRAGIEELRRLYAGARLAERLPIGVREDRDAFDAAKVRAFYERWYRPEQMTLVIVGDLAGLDPEPLVREVFAGLRAPTAPALLEPPAGHAERAERFFAVHEADLPQARVTLSLLRPWVARADSSDERLRLALEGMALSMLNLRFQEKVKLAETPYLAASVGALDGMKVWEGGQLSVIAAPERWEDSFRAAHLDLRAALNWGFQEAEIEELRADWLRALDEAVEREPTAPSARLREAILRAVEEGDVPLSAASERALLREMVATATVEQCLEALRALWKGGEPSLVLTGPVALERDAEHLATLYEKSRAARPEKPAALARAEFAYASDPERAGAVVQRTHVEDLDFWAIRFENGVQLNLKRTDFAERQILLQARVGEGLLAYEPDEVLTLTAGAAGLDQAGLAAHSADELRRIFAGRQVGWSVGIEADHFGFAGATTSEDLLLQLELLCAHLTAPGWRAEGLQLFQKQIPLIRQALRSNPIGPLLIDFLPQYLGNDYRLSFFGQLGPLPPFEAMEQVTMEQVGALIAPQWADALVEVTIVGDLDPDAVVAAAARTLGVLPQRRAAVAHAARREVPPLPRGLEVHGTVATADRKAQVYLFFPLTDGMDTELRRCLSVLGLVVDDRLRLEVRERLGAAYAPSAAVDASRVFRGFGVLMIDASSAPDGVEALVEACRQVAATLAAEGVGAEEVARLTAPVISQVRDQRRTNDYWLRELAQAQSQPDSLANPRTVIDFYEDLGPERITELAARFLGADAASLLVVMPE